MGPHDPYWRTNTSFSPPPSRWDFRFQSEGLPYNLNDGVQLNGSSTLSNRKDSRGWERGNQLHDLHYSGSDGTGPFFSSPSYFSQDPQQTPPVVQEISIDDYETATRKDPSLGRITFTPIKEGTSENPDSGDSILSWSESSESEFSAKSHLPSQPKSSSRGAFISKPIYPLSFPDLSPTREAFDPAITSFSEVGASTPFRDSQRWSSASSSLDFADASGSFESDTPARLNIHSDGYKCSLCERFLSQRSPWCSHRIVRSGDMPTTGVLPCRHVFHAECLEHSTPKIRKNDPPCPLCIQGEESFRQQQGPLRLRNGFLRIRPFYEDGTSRPWGYMQVGDCVEGVLHAPPRNTMFLLNQNHIKKNLSLKDNVRKELPGKLQKGGHYPSQLFFGSSADQEAVGCSKAIASPSMNR